MRVLIIGAGLGGLALAHGLRRAGIAVAVHERSPRSGAQPASYGIHINADGARALRACLPEANWQLFDARSTPAKDVVRFRDTSLAVLSTIDKDTPEAVADPVTHRRAVRRDALRGALLAGLADDAPDAVVHYGRTFTSYEVGPGGHITAHFADGSTDHGDLLVGADASNSRVRHQYLPDVVRQELGILVLAGRLPVADARRVGLPDDMLDSSMSMVVPAGPGWMFSATWSTPGPEPGADPGQDHLVWAYAGARASYPDGVLDQTPDRWRELLVERTAGWAPALREMVRHTPTDTLAPVPLRTMPTLPAWRPTTVTLLGDAIHNMTPMAGIGANTALRDADTLRLALVEAAAGRRELTAAVGDYESRMRAYANEALALSTRNARNAAAGKRLPRLAFRTMLRVAGTVAPITRAVFATAPRHA